MNLSLYIAKRYLFSKKSHNAINVISTISVCGTAVATAALICALSVFNGFTSLTESLFSAIDPDVKITPTHGKVFKNHDLDLMRIKDIDGVEVVAESLEENALLKHSDRQQIITFKGVSSEFQKLTDIDNVIYEGIFQLQSGTVNEGVAGQGLSYLLGIRPGFLTPLELHVPKRGVQVNLMNPSTAFNKVNVYLTGTFALNREEYDEQMFIIPIELARDLLNYEDEVSSIDIRIKEGFSVSAVKAEIQETVGSDFEAKDRFEQQAEMYRVINLEKWITFFIIVLISAIAVFNIVGSLSMLIIEKKEDIGIIRSMGANNKLVLRIFLFEGWIIVFAGAVIGLILGLALCFIQQYFGIIKLGDSQAFIVDSFPVAVQAFDVIAAFFTICCVGLVATLYPVLNLRKNLIT